MRKLVQKKRSILFLMLLAFLFSVTNYVELIQIDYHKFPTRLKNGEKVSFGRRVASTLEMRDLVMNRHWAFYKKKFDFHSQI